MEACGFMQPTYMGISGSGAWGLKSSHQTDSMTTDLQLSDGLISVAGGWGGVE